MGTPQFLAPEQIAGRTLPQTDQYAMGVVLYECLTKSLPYHSHAIVGLLRAIDEGDFTRPARCAATFPNGSRRSSCARCARCPRSALPPSTRWGARCGSSRAPRRASGGALTTSTSGGRRRTTRRCTRCRSSKRWRAGWRRPRRRESRLPSFPQRRLPGSAGPSRQASLIRRHPRGRRRHPLPRRSLSARRRGR